MIYREKFRVEKLQSGDDEDTQEYLLHLRTQEGKCKTYGMTLKEAKRLYTKLAELFNESV